eukprot:TRINITY_DN4258_c0_g1_i7.p2 TRINITY_DN4258_c0_g1~~TRINITY_DN4258_c0_g1_i7.p2  ORF type:complete len:209 (+),score=102.99 TRINITY_DN4258_c0_g1_i7:50-676(+)
MPMVGRFGAVAAATRHQRRSCVGNSRIEAQRAYARQERETAKLVAQVMEKYDTDQSGALSEDQVERLLTDLDYTTPPGTKPTQEELAFVMQCADKRRNKRIDRDELIGAVTVYNAYLKDKNRIDAVLTKYDDNQSGALDFAQTKKLLVDLNDGIEVSDNEVKMVMSYADVGLTGDLKRVEVLLAINYWYHMAEIEEEEKGKGGCCVVL